MALKPSAILTDLSIISGIIQLLILPNCWAIREHIRRDSSQQTLTAKNLFIEPDFLTKCQDVQTQSQFYKTEPSIKRLYECVPSSSTMGKHSKRSVLVTGGAGFVGSHLVDSLMLDGHRVIVLDNFYTGRKANIEHWLNHENFKLIEHDVVKDLDFITSEPIHQIYHLASPASPRHYMANRIATINTIVLGTMHALELAKEKGARILIASTSEIYGNPLVHPQHEDYWGNTNPIGPRACYDESKRISETMAITGRDLQNTSISIARIFNTYGPRMSRDDGRVISNFITQTIQNKPITVYGTGNQTRSFQYITDLVRGLRSLMNSTVMSPINLGNPEEITILELANEVRKIVPRSSSPFVHEDLPADDPQRRRPAIDRARESLNWQPNVSLIVGLGRTIDYFIQDLKS